jgi:glycosyltransferase involved in cell wall biosynthesis
MSDRRYRVLTIASHPVQYGAPIFRVMAQHPQLDFQVAYCSLRGAEPGHDPEFGTTVEWDIPLLDGYSWTHVPNQGTGAESFFGLRNPGLWKLIRTSGFDAVICHLSYLRASFWVAYLAAHSRGTPFLFGTDASAIEPRDGRSWKRILKGLAWPMVFRLAGQVLTASSAGYDMMRSLGIPEERISMTLDTVDNGWWLAECARADRATVRRAWGIGEEEKVVLFCGKLQPWKRPLDVLKAFAAAAISGSRLIFAGEGAERTRLEAEASTLGIRDRVHFLGFVNQSQLPGVYKASDLMVIASEYEPFGLVVNEAMLCGCPVVASDKVGAVRDLIVPGRTGFVYPCGDTRALATILQQLLSDPAGLSIIRKAALERMESWSQKAGVAAMVEAVARAVSRARRSPVAESESTTEPRPSGRFSG